MRAVKRGSLGVEGSHEEESGVGRIASANHEEASSRTCVSFARPAGARKKRSQRHSRPGCRPQVSAGDEDGGLFAVAPPSAATGRPFKGTHNKWRWAGIGGGTASRRQRGEPGDGAQGRQCPNPSRFRECPPDQDGWSDIIPSGSLYGKQNCDRGNRESRNFMELRATRFPQKEHRLWRRGWDSNPRYGVTVYTRSRRAPSTARPPPRRCGK